MVITKNDRKFLALSLLFMATNSLEISVKKPISLILLFSKQCSTIGHNSVLPSSTVLIINQYLSNIRFKKDNLKRIIYKLCPTRTYGNFMISIRMLKMSGDAIIDPLFTICKYCLKCRIFPDDSKKGNVIPIFKKGDKQKIKNYCPVCLLEICTKVFERIRFDIMLKKFLDNNLISPKQSRLRLGDSCVNQLLLVTHDIFTSFENSLEVRGVSISGHI